MLEKQVERKLVEGVKRLGGRALKWVSPGTVGVPDRTVLLPGGRVVFVELKTETGRLSSAQKIQLAKLSSLGMDVRVLYGEKDVQVFLESCRNEGGEAK